MAQGKCDGTSVLGKHNHRSGDPAARPPGDQPRRHQGAERGPTDPQQPRRPVALRRPQRGVAQPHWVLLESRRPGATPLPMRPGADAANTPPASLSPPTSPARGRWPSRARCSTGRGWPPPSPYNTVPTDHGSTRWTPKSSSASCGTQIASGPRGSPRAQRRLSTRCPCGGSGTACAREGNTLGTRSGTSEPPRTTVTPYCTRWTGRRPRTSSCRTRPRTLATPNSLSPAVTAISIYGPPGCGCSARSRSGRRRTMR